MRLAVAVLAAALVLPVHAYAQAGTPTKADVQQWFDTRNATRNKGDWAGYAQFFTNDATIGNSDGTSYGGRAEIQKRTQELYGTGTYKGVHSSGTVLSVAAITPDVIVVDATFELANIAGGGSRKGFSVVVMLKQGSEWKIAASRSMVPTKAGALPAQR